MQALRKTRPEAGLELVDMPAPVVDADSSDVLVKVSATGICGSDLHVDDWTPSYAFITPSIPVTIGHEFVGVAQTGPTGRPARGRSSLGHVRRLRRLRRGRPRWLREAPRHRHDARWRLRALGPGSVAQLRAGARQPERRARSAHRAAHHLDAGASHRRRRGRPARAGDGPGHHRPGHRRAGTPCRREAGGGQRIRRRGALRRIAPHGLRCVGRCGQRSRWPKAPGRTPAASPSISSSRRRACPKPSRKALALLRRNGIVVVTGIHARPLLLDLTPMVRNQQQLRGSFRPPESDWPLALELMGEMDAVMRPMVSHVLAPVASRRGFCAGARRRRRARCCSSRRRAMNDD